ncbi:hypothetical protein IAI10_16450 [Clostridium sp. 19966]|uniref:hypothetical protein n=1 Tax=Clostridium sp. 19966 TaxID=2768166 RepID=UPI0028DE6815|nr:hypothetical protein [Clostridium sp. 19966]MDT8718259.1 hypothetical protein [Clostridium sp. 19966]
MIHEFNFEKSGFQFKFKNPKLDKGNKLVLEWKVLGSEDCENNKYTEDGYFGNAKLDTEKKAIICDFTVGKKKMTGVIPPEDIFNELTTLYIELKAERSTLFEKTVNEVAEGKRNIDVSIVGCDHPLYQAYLKDCPEDLKGHEQSIVKLAIMKVTNDFVGNSCDYIEKRLKQSIGTKERINPKAFNLRFEEEVQKYHDYPNDVVTGFEMKLSDAIKLDEYLNKKVENEAKIKAIFDKAKETGEKQELEHWTDPCNDPDEECDLDIVYVYAMPDGTTQKIRNHTW